MADGRMSHNTFIIFSNHNIYYVHHVPQRRESIPLDLLSESRGWTSALQKMKKVLLGIKIMVSQTQQNTSVCIKCTPKWNWMAVFFALVGASSVPQVRGNKHWHQGPVQIERIEQLLLCFFLDITVLKRTKQTLMATLFYLPILYAKEK